MKNKYPFLKDLNKEQFKAATTIEGPVLILAGAGSGKTKTLISRTAFILASKSAEPENILIMTFTNKAAREMKERGSEILKDFDLFTSPDFTTFHSWGAKFLRNLDNYILNQFNLTNKFNIADSSDQKTILNKLKHDYLSEDNAKAFKADLFLLNLTIIQNNETSYYNFEKAIKEINKLSKNSKLNLSYFKDINKKLIEEIANLYIAYKQELRRNNLIDFDDLINIPNEVLNIHKDIKKTLNNKYKYIMVDEFQDTNKSQLNLLKNLLNKKDNICVVGDDSQSIYGWRGANISYILNFHKDFDKCININLNINYRSSKLIVKKANKLLKKAEERHEHKKDLVSNQDSNGIVQSKFFKTNKEEFVSIAKSIKYLITEKNVKPGDIALLYRTAFIIRELEEEFITLNIPYKIHKGKTLLERKISKTLISYLKLLFNERNDIALMTLLLNNKILTDKRLSDFSLESKNKNMELIEYLNSGEYKNFPRIAKTTINKVDSFLEEFYYFKDLLNMNNFSNFLKRFFNGNIIKDSNEAIVQESFSTTVPEQKLNEAESNLKILDILQKICLRYDDLDTLLEVITLEGEEEDCEEDKVNLMTIHASKGLEFRVVFVIGAVNGIFPGPKCTTKKQLEEERRLFYVAITRAKYMLRVSGAEAYFKNQQEKHTPSLFINEAKIDIS